MGDMISVGGPDRAGVSMRSATLGKNIYDKDGNRVAYVQAHAVTDSEIPNSVGLGDAIVDAAEAGIAVIRQALAEQEQYQDAVVQFSLRVLKPTENTNMTRPV